MPRDTIQRELLMGMVRIHILHHAAERPIHGLWMIVELRRHGYEISPGTLYPILHSLARAGYLDSDREVVAGKVRRNYVLTALGREALAEARVRLRELAGEVLDDGA